MSTFIQTLVGTCAPAVVGAATVDINGMSVQFFAGAGDEITIRASASGRAGGGGWFEFSLFVNGTRVAGSIGQRNSSGGPSSNQLILHRYIASAGQQTIKCQKGSASGTNWGIDPQSNPGTDHGVLLVKQFRP